jgi:hypothetical protein
MQIHDKGSDCALHAMENSKQKIMIRTEAQGTVLRKNVKVGTKKNSSTTDRQFKYGS